MKFSTFIKKQFMLEMKKMTPGRFLCYFPLGCWYAVRSFGQMIFAFIVIGGLILDDQPEY